MKVSFDPAKSERNAAERGLPFDMAVAFDFETALIWQDVRRDYGESRYVAIGQLGERLHVLCFTENQGRHPRDQPAQGERQGGWTVWRSVIR